MADSVLIVDDDVTITQVLSLLLKTHGYDVLVANSGKDGIQIIQSESPQVVILDLMMPDMDGWEVCRRVRTFSNIPIIILSAVSDARIISQAKEYGANGYLVKPVPSELLVSQLRFLVRQNPLQN